MTARPQLQGRAMAKKHIRHIYEKAAGGYDSLIEPYLLGVWRDALGMSHISKNARILDLGCGCGGMLREIITDYKGHTLSLTGVDASDGMIEEAKKIGEVAKNNGHRLSLICQDCIKYLEACEEGAYDVVVTAFMLSYVRASKLFPLVSRALRKGGKFVVITTSDDHLRPLEKIAFDFTISHFARIKWWLLLRTLLFSKLSYTQPLETNIRLLHRSNFSKDRVQEKSTFLPVEFDSAKSFFRWLDESGFAAQYYVFFKMKKEEIYRKMGKFFEKKKYEKIRSSLFKVEKPFTFRWPIYTIVAEK